MSVVTLPERTFSTQITTPSAVLVATGQTTLTIEPFSTVDWIDDGRTLTIEIDIDKSGTWTHLASAPVKVGSRKPDGSCGGLSLYYAGGLPSGSYRVVVTPSAPITAGAVVTVT